METTRRVRRKHVETVCDLPMDLISEILSYLPVKPLLQFKTVSKSWYSLIESSKFIKNHLKRSNRNPDPSITSILVTAWVPETKQYSMFLKLKGRSSAEYPKFRFRLSPQVVGICDGLVCVTFSNFETIVCNPAIGMIRRIPNCCLPNVSPSHVYMGFRFQVTSGYSLFRIIYSCSQSGEIVIDCEVYTRSTDVWRQIEVKRGDIYTPKKMIQNRWWSRMPVDLNGVFYWEAFESGVMFFDTHNDVFGEIIWPKRFIVGHTDSWKLMEWKGELAVLVCFGIGYLDLWVLGGNQKNSWTNKFRAVNLPVIGIVMREVRGERNRKPVIQQYMSQNNMLIFAYDLESHQIEYFPLSGTLGYEDDVFYLLTESLLSV